MSRSACAWRNRVLKGRLALLGPLGLLAFPAGVLEAAPAETASPPLARPSPRPAVGSRPAPRPAVESRPAPRPAVESRPAPRPSGETLPGLKTPALTGPVPPPRRGWALAAAVVGTVGAGAVLGLALGGERFKSRRQLPTVAYSGASLGVGTLLGPLVYVGGWMARKRHGVEGSWLLRSLGWVAYGGMLASAIALGVRSSQGTVPENGMLTFTGALGALGLLFLSGDALISFLRARGAASSGTASAAGPEAAVGAAPEAAPEAAPDPTSELAPPAPVPLGERLRLAPLLAPFRAPDGRIGGLAGIQGTF